MNDGVTIYMDLSDVLRQGPSPFESATATVTRALVDTRDLLVSEWAHRDRLNDEIRQLVAEEDRLRRMARLTQTNGDGGDPGGADEPAGERGSTPRG